MKAAICEDEIRALHTIKSTIAHGMQELSMECGIDAFSVPGSLADRLRRGEAYDVFFLDIDMPGTNGIELSKQIRFFLPDALIIFISNKEELVFQAFEARPFRFIRKNHFKEELPAVLTALKRELDLERGPVITVEEPRGKILSLQVEDILYVEAMRKECIIHRKTDTVNCKYKFRDFLEILEPLLFAQTHRSYAVNCRYIFRINSDSVLLDNGETIPLGRTHRNNVKNGFLKYTKTL